MNNSLITIRRTRRVGALSDLPFEQVIQELPDKETRRRFFGDCFEACGFRSDSMMWRIRTGKGRPNFYQRRLLAKVVRRYTKDKRYTGENLFPAEFYFKKGDQGECGYHQGRPVGEELPARDAGSAPRDTGGGAIYVKPLNV